MIRPANLRVVFFLQTTENLQLLLQTKFTKTKIRFYKLYKNLVLNFEEV